MPYWLSMDRPRRFMADGGESAQRNREAARAFEMLSGTAPLLIVFGRFVPGLRFIVGATIGRGHHGWGFSTSR